MALRMGIITKKLYSFFFVGFMCFFGAIKQAYMDSLIIKSYSCAVLALVFCPMNPLISRTVILLDACRLHVKAICCHSKVAYRVVGSVVVFMIYVVRAIAVVKLENKAMQSINNPIYPYMVIVC